MATTSITITRRLMARIQARRRPAGTPDAVVEGRGSVVVAAVVAAVVVAATLTTVVLTGLGRVGQAALVVARLRLAVAAVVVAWFRVRVTVVTGAVVGTVVVVVSGGVVGAVAGGRAELGRRAVGRGGAGRVGPETRAGHEGSGGGEVGDALH